MRMSKHEAQCTVCKHADRAAIERKFINWTSRVLLEQEYELPRDSLYRHAKGRRVSQSPSAPSGMVFA